MRTLDLKLLRELRRHRRLHGIERGVRIGLIDPVKGQLDPFQHPAGLFHRYDGVVERRRGRIIGDLAHFLDLDRHAALDRGLIIAVLDLIERRGVEWQRAGRGEGIGARGLGLCGRGRHGAAGKRGSAEEKRLDDHGKAALLGVTRKIDERIVAAQPRSIKPRRRGPGQGGAASSSRSAPGLRAGRARRECSPPAPWCRPTGAPNPSHG